ncbi:MAG: PaaX family transcriptional regulator C-terminal domain-containing protein [Actinomycetales bacterium]
MRSAEPTPTPRTLIEAFLPMHGTADLAIVYDTAAAAGIADQPVRLALRRMTAAGVIEVSGRGRKAVVQLTDAGRAELEKDRLGLRLALAQDEGVARWDGNWRLLAVSTPEAHRKERDSLRRELVDLGAANVSTGLFISPHDLTEVLGSAHQAALVRVTASRVDVRGVSDPVAITQLLWPAEPVLDGYRALARTLENVGTPATRDPDAALVAQLHLAEALERALRHDPLIPPELRAQPWPATQVRQSWRRMWTHLSTIIPGEGLYPDWLP